MGRTRFCRSIVLAALTLPFWGAFIPSRAEDQIDVLLRSGRVPQAMMHDHGYSDFSDPLGRFMDLLSAGAFAEARAVQPAACATWLATRPDSPLTGKFWAFDTEIDLNVLCATH